jgi:hypothetical protein
MKKNLHVLNVLFLFSNFQLKTGKKRKYLLNKQKPNKKVKLFFSVYTIMFLMKKKERKSIKIKKIQILYTIFFQFEAPLKD